MLFKIGQIIQNDRQSVKIHLILRKFDKIPLILHISSLIELVKCIVIYSCMYGPWPGRHTIWVHTHSLTGARLRKGMSKDQVTPHSRTVTRFLLLTNSNTFWKIWVYKFQYLHQKSPNFHNFCCIWLFTDWLLKSLYLSHFLRMLFVFKW